MKMRELNTNEIEAVSGGWVPVIGGITGAATYLGSAATSGQFSWGGLAASTATGAVVPLRAASAAGTYLAPRVGFAGGAVQGSQ